MNILLFSWRGPGHPHAGGAEISTYQHAKGWVKAGHQVTLFTSYYQGAKDEENLDGIRIIRQGSQFFGVHIKAFIWYFFGNHQKYDLVIDEFHGIPFFTPLYVKGKKLAIIHEVTKEVWSLNPWSWPFNLIPAFLGLAFEQYIFKLFYRTTPFMTGSNSTKKDLIAWGIPQANITLIPYGVNTPKVKSFQKENKKTTIFLGVLSKDKGIEDTLKIFSILNNSGDNFQFWVVGKGEDSYLKELKLQANELGIDKTVKFWGFVSEEKKFELLSHSHVLINTSIREGWGLVVIEAAAMSTPTVAFDVPGLRDSILNGRTGIIDKQHSINSIASEIIDLLSDDNRYQRMKVAAVKWSKKFSWKDSIIKSLDLINKIMKSSNY